MSEVLIDDSADPGMPDSLVELFKESADVIKDLLLRATVSGSAPEEVAIIVLEREDVLEGRTVPLDALRELHRNPLPLNDEADQVWSTATKFLLDQPAVPGATLVLCVGINSEWGVAYFIANSGVFTNSPGGSA